MKRVATAELLDTDSGTPAEIADSLSDLRRFNRWLGGISTTRSMIEQVATELGVQSLSLLEVAAGSGYPADPRSGGTGAVRPEQGEAFREAEGGGRSQGE